MRLVVIETRKGPLSGTVRNSIKGEGRGRVGNGGGDPWIKNSVVK